MSDQPPAGTPADETGTAPDYDDVPSRAAQEAADEAALGGSPVDAAVDLPATPD